MLQVNVPADETSQTLLRVVGRSSEQPQALLAAELAYTQRVLKRLLTQARRLQFVADWVDLRDAKREHRKLNERYRKGLEAAATPSDRDAIQGQYRAEYDLLWDPIYIRETDELIARARKYGVQVPPLPTDYAADNNWYLSHATGVWIFTSEAEERLRREIRDEKRQSDDEFRKWATLGISIAAFILALLSLKAKQPDPCPRNYYRSDSGECVFAPQKASTSQPQQGIPPIPSMQQKKPSPTKPKP
jgi:hypothetical protein